MARDGKMASSRVDPTRNRDAVSTWELSLDGMKAQPCAAKVEEALLSVPGVLDCVVNLLTGIATLHLSTKLWNSVALEAEADSRMRSAVALVHHPPTRTSFGRDVLEAFEIAIARAGPCSLQRTFKVTGCWLTMVDLRIKGMRCAKYCTQVVRRSLLDVPEVVEADMSFEGKTARVWMAREVHPQDGASSRSQKEQRDSSGTSGGSSLVGSSDFEELLQSVRLVGYDAVVLSHHREFYSPKPDVEEVELSRMEGQPSPSLDAHTLDMFLQGFVATAYAVKVQEALMSHPGVVNCTVNSMDRKATLDVECTKATNPRALQRSLDLYAANATASSAPVQILSHLETALGEEDSVEKDKVKISEERGEESASSTHRLHRPQSEEVVQAEVESAACFTEVKTPQGAPPTDIFPDQTQEPLPSPRDAEQGKTLTMKVFGMTCGACIRTITTALRNEGDAVQCVDVSLDEQRVTVVYDPHATTAETLRDVVETVGFDASFEELTEKVYDRMETWAKRLPLPTIALDDDLSLDEDFEQSDTPKAPYVAESSPSESSNKRQRFAPADEVLKARISIAGMSCSSCVAKIEQSLLNVAGVTAASISLPLELGVVSFVPSVVDEGFIVEAIKKLGYGVLDCQVDRPVGSSADELGEVMVGVDGMTCSSCVHAIETVLKKHPGVLSASVSLPLEQAVIKYRKSFTSGNELALAIERAGYNVAYVKEKGEKRQKGHSGSDEDPEKLREMRMVEEEREARRILKVCFAATVPIWGILLLGLIPWFDDEVFGVEIVPGLTVKSVLLFIPATIVQFYCGWIFYVESFYGLRRGDLNMSLLVVLGTSAAYFYGLFSIIYAMATDMEHMAMPHMFFDSATLITFILLGRYLKHSATKKTSAALAKLASLQSKTAVLCSLAPETDVNSIMDAHVRADDEDARQGTEGLARRIVAEREVDVDNLGFGDVLKVVRGSSVPADGVVIEGEGDVDESMLTGESIPVSKRPGAQVMAGTLNLEGLFYMKVEHVGEETTLSSIVRLVREAQLSKAPIQMLADKIASVFVPIVVTIATVSLVTWLTLAETGAIPESWIDMDSTNFLFALEFFITTLVIACPCAMGLATPTAVMVGTGVGARFGVLIKGGEPLERAHHVKSVIFDKTGTLTEGKPVVTDLFCPSTAIEGSVDSEWSVKDIIYHMGSAELGSEHPLARAVVAFAEEWLGARDSKEGGAPELVQPENFAAVSGRGLSCSVNGQRVVIGNEAWIQKELSAVLARSNIDGKDWSKVAVSLIENVAHTHSFTLSEATLELQKAGKTAVYVALGERLVGIVGIADRPRPEARYVVRALRDMNVDVWMVTGDNKRTARAIAGEVDIPEDRIMADVLPADKAGKVRELQGGLSRREDLEAGFVKGEAKSSKEKANVVCMVGDGINDSPALAAADLGIALGGATDVAMETADVVLMRSDLRQVLISLHLSRIVFRRIQMNFVWAFGYNVLLIPFAAGLLFPLVQFVIPPWVSGIAMAGSSISVVLSSLHLNLYSPPADWTRPLYSDRSETSCGVL